MSDVAEAFLRSARAEDSTVMPLRDLPSWLDAQRAARALTVRRIPFAALDQWDFAGTPRSLTHRSGQFFTVEGVRVTTDFGPVPIWDQPIIRQDEIGILGLLVREIDGVLHFLMQAKIEPGNINGLQLSPTVQSTRSNYTRVHGGRQTAYNEYFVEPGRARILIDRLLVEQGTRFAQKRNRNMIVGVEEDIAAEDGFCWLTLGQIERLLGEDNRINMSARSVLSCIPVPSQRSGGGRHSDDELLNWLDGLRARHSLVLTRRPLDELAGWIVEGDVIRHVSGRHFAVVAVAVEATAREVTRWSQPILEHSGRGLNGLLIQRIGGVLHVLARACMFPGSGRRIEIGSTVSGANATLDYSADSRSPFVEYFRDAPQSWIRHGSRQSEEGGRFRNFVSDYRIIELPEEHRISAPEDYRWMTVEQYRRFNSYGNINIEGRNLLVCLGFTGKTES